MVRLESVRDRALMKTRDTAHIMAENRMSGGPQPMA